MPTWKRRPTDFAESDPRRFLSQFGGGAIIDEVQHVPALLSYLQVLADENGRNSLFVLTGSEQFRLSNAISQSLAGRTALLRLLPFSLSERRRMSANEAMDDIIYSGFYPRIHDQGLDPSQALGDYFETYVERDVRRLGEIRNLSSFRRFVRLCAGRVGQLVNFGSLGSDAGVSHTTARACSPCGDELHHLSATTVSCQYPEASGQVTQIVLPRRGAGQLPDRYREQEQVTTHPLRGALFENVVVSRRSSTASIGAANPISPFSGTQGGWNVTFSMKLAAASGPSRSSPAPRLPLTTVIRSTAWPP